MKDSMVKSQFESLEPPETDEVDCLTVDVSGDFEAVQGLAKEVVDATMALDAGVAGAGSVV